MTMLRTNGGNEGATSTLLKYQDQQVQAINENLYSLTCFVDFEP